MHNAANVSEAHSALFCTAHNVALNLVAADGVTRLPLDADLNCRFIRQEDFTLKKIKPVNEKSHHVRILLEICYYVTQTHT